MLLTAAGIFCFVCGLLLLLADPVIGFVSMAVGVGFVLWGKKLRAQKETKRQKQVSREIAGYVAETEPSTVQSEPSPFSEAIETIPETTILLSDKKIKRHKQSELPDFRSTNITKASNRNALGSFIAIDTETTGLSPWNDRIVELSAVRYIDWKPFDRFTTLINPGRPIPERASEINGITDDMVEDAPTISQVIPAFQQYLGKYNIVGHNVTFDLKFLFASGLDFQPAASRKIYDTLALSRRVLEKDIHVPDYKLQTLCDFYRIRPERYAHRSMSDCLATAQLFTILADEKM